MGGGLSASERAVLWWLARKMPDPGRVCQLGVWRGASVILFLEAFANRHLSITGIDGFDLDGISVCSGQAAVAISEAEANIEHHARPWHDLSLFKSDTRGLLDLPNAPFDLIFVDAGHTAECVVNDLRLAMAAVARGGLIVLHDYGEPAWPEVKTVATRLLGDPQWRRQRLAGWNKGWFERTVRAPWETDGGGDND